MYQSDVEIEHMWIMVTEIVANYANRIPLQGASITEKVHSGHRIRLILNQQTGRCKVVIKNVNDDCFLTVFDCKQNRRASIYRTGKWCAYVDALYEKIDRQRREAMSSVGMQAPIDAEQLQFPSKDDEPDPYPNFNEINDWDVAYS